MKKILILLSLFSLPAVWFLIRPGFYEPHDLHHLADIYEMYRAFLMGQFPPRLGPDFSFGFGYPLYNYYYLLPFYLGALFYALAGSLTLSFKLVFLTGVILGVSGIYLFMRERFGRAASFAAAVLFLYTPYRAVQIYVRGAIGEMLALSLLPWVFWGLARLIKNPSKKWIGINAVIFFLFIISHNYFFVLSVPFILLYLIFTRTKGFNYGYILIYLLIAVLLSSYWIGPALLEKSLVRGETPFPLIDHFPFIKQLILPSWGYGSSVWGSYDEISFQIGIINLAVVTASLFYFVLHGSLGQKNKNYGVLVWALACFFISVVLMNQRTYFLWKIMPFHDLIQFPWRLLTFTTFFSSITLAFILDRIKGKRQMLAAAITSLAAIALTFNYFRPSKAVAYDDGHYLNRFFNDKNWSEDYLLLPTWVGSRPEKPADKEIEFTAANTAVANHYYFPGWIVRVNGTEVPTNPESKTGRIEFTAGKADKIEVEWTETNMRRFFDLLSLAAFISVLYMLFLSGKTYGKRSKH